MSGGIVGVATPDPGTNALIQRLANPPNPLTQAGESVNALANIKEFAAQNALTGIYQQSIDPTTGQVDLGKFNALASQNPAALWKFGQTMQSAGTGVGNEGQGTSAQLNARLDQLGAQAAYMTPLIAKAQAGTVTADDIRGVLKDMPPGLVSPTTIANINQQLDSGANPNNVVWGAMFANEHGRATLSGALGPGATVNQGPQATFVRPFSPIAPGGVSSPPVPIVPGVEPVTLTVGTQTIPNVPYNIAVAITQNPELLKVYYRQQYEQMHPGDQVTMSPGAGGTAPAPSVPPGHYPTPIPAPPPAAGGGGGGGGGGAPAPAAPGGGGGGPAPAPAPPPAAGGGGGGGGTEKPQPTGPLYLQPPPPQPAEAGGVGLTPQTGYNENVQVPSQKAATALVTAAKDTPNVAGLIQDMRAQVNQPGWNPGLGAQAGSTWRQVLDKVGVNATGQTPDAQKMAQASYDEFAKDANLIASRQLATLGNVSDARQGLAEAITPGMAQSKEGVLGISATLMGNQDAINRTAASWAQAQANGWTSGRHNEWLANNWNATDPATGGRFDPRVFWLADTEGTRADQIKRFANKIPQGQQAQFLKNVQYAKNQGWIKQNDDGSFAVTGP